MSIFKQLAKSLYSPKDIAKFRYQSIGKTILYIFFLALIITIPAAIHFSTGINKAVNEATNIIQEDIPPFKIEKGVLTLDSNEAVIIQKKNFTLILDATGKMTTDDITNYPNSIGLLKNEAIIVTGYQPQSFDYSMFEDMTITDQNLKSIIETANSMLPIFIPLVILFIYLFSSGTKFIEVTFFAFITLFIRKMAFKQKMRFRHAWIIAAYSITLAAIFFTIMDLFKIFVPFSILLTWFVHTTIIYLTLKEIN